MTRRYLTVNEQGALLMAQSCRCAACKCALKGGDYEFDHSTPHAFRPERKPDQALCIPCHRKKSARDVKAIRKSIRLHRTFVLGIKPKRRPIAARGFDRRYRRRLDGTVEIRT